MNHPIPDPDWPVVAGRLRAHLEARLPDMLDLVRRLAAMETPSDVPAAQAPLLAALAAELEPLGLRVTLLPGERTGGQLMAAAPDFGPDHPGQLLLGHADTVWPLGTLERLPLTVDGDRLRGPGVLDMKAGLVQMIFALRALRALHLPPGVPPVVFINTDEEIGSPESTAAIARLAVDMDRALVLEPAQGAEGRLKTARKGVGEFHLTARGRASHAGLAPEEGINAILALTATFPALTALNEPARGVTVNVGVIRGGARANVVPATCEAAVDVRAPTAADARRVEAAIHALQPGLPGASLEIAGEFDRLPLERTRANQALWQMARRLGRHLGLELAEAAVGGASDGNTTSQTTATLDGLGPIGAGAHADHEHILLSSLPERAALLAMILLAPPVGGAPEVDDGR